MGVLSTRRMIVCGHAQNTRQQALFKWPKGCLLFTAMLGPSSVSPPPAAQAAQEAVQQEALQMSGFKGMHVIPAKVLVQAKHVEQRQQALEILPQAQAEVLQQSPTPHPLIPSTPPPHLSGKHGPPPLCMTSSA